MKDFFNKYDIVVGLEIHAELNTKTKLLCGCANMFGNDANTNCCPICLAYPNAKPILNKSAVEKAIIAGLATDCNINTISFWERKCYFYPDMPAGFQTSQNLNPLCIDGKITLKNGKQIGIKQIHLEEDSGKLLHNSLLNQTLIDYNRAGVPLIEIVSKPDITSPEEAVEFLEEVRSRLVFAEIADCKMEQGGLRCDVNISIVKKGQGGLGVRTEIKNLSSFKAVSAAITFEAQHHAKLLESGKSIEVQTKKWDEQNQKTIPLRLKETAQYIPAPDLPVLHLSSQDIERLKANMPVLAHQLKQKFLEDFLLPEYDAQVLTKTKETANFFLNCVKLFNEPKKVSNWIMMDLFKVMNQQENQSFTVSEKDFTDIIKMVEDKLITKTVGLELLEKVINTKQSPLALAKSLNLFETIDDQQIEGILTNLQKENPKVVEDYKSNPDKVLKFIVGYVMKHTKGKARSDMVEKAIKKLF